MCVRGLSAKLVQVPSYFKFFKEKTFYYLTQLLRLTHYIYLATAMFLQTKYNQYAGSCRLAADLLIK